MNDKIGNLILAFGIITFLVTIGSLTQCMKEYANDITGYIYNKRDEKLTMEAMYMNSLCLDNDGNRHRIQIVFADSFGTTVQTVSKGVTHTNRINDFYVCLRNTDKAISKKELIAVKERENSKGFYRF